MPRVPESPRVLRGIEPLPEPDMPPGAQAATRATVSWTETREVRITFEHSPEHWFPVRQGLYRGDRRCYASGAHVRWARSWASPHDEPERWVKRMVYAVGWFWDITSFAQDSRRPGVWTPGERTYYSDDRMPEWLVLAVAATRPTS